MSLSHLTAQAASDRIGPYRLLRELGRGGMGVVYEAVHEQLGKRVALKQIQPQLRDQAQVERFIREGRAACQIRHPHVVEVYELGTHAGAPYLAMALLDGISLEELLHASQRIALAAALQLLFPIFSAVSAAHAAGVVHRDLKPSNIMLAREARRALRPTLLDFGASKLDEMSSSPLTNSGTVLGTLPYMAAEQLFASRDADAQSDQYSLAVILYECVTGRRPFLAASGYQLMQAIMTEPVAKPSQHEPSLPLDLDAVLMRALERDPRARYPSVAAFAHALLPFAAAECRAAWQPEFAVAQVGTQPPAFDAAPSITRLDSARAAPATVSVHADTEAAGESDSQPLPSARAARGRLRGFAVAAFGALGALGLSGGHEAQPAAPAPDVQSRAPEPPSPRAETIDTASIELPPPTESQLRLVTAARSASALPPQPTATPVHQPVPAARAHRAKPRAEQRRPSDRPPAIPLGENGAPILE